MKRCQSRCPFFLARCLACAEVDAKRPKVGGAARLWRAAEYIRAPGDLEIDKASSHDRGLKLCIQQSTGDSAGPEVDLAFGALWNGLLHQDIANLQAPARLEHARHLGQVAVDQVAREVLQHVD